MSSSIVRASTAGWSLAAFGLLAAAPAWGQNMIFRPSAATSINETMDGAVCVAVGDVDKDGKPDIVVGSHEGVLLLRGSGGAQFEPGKRLPASPAVSVALADFDRDGKLDLAAYAQERNTIFVLKGGGDGTFEPAAALATSDAPKRHLAGAAMLAADLNQDGFLDLAVAQEKSIAVFPGNGNGTFQPRVEVTGLSPFSIVAADFTGDGVVDLATSQVESSDISVLPGSGRGAFGPAVNTAVDSAANTFVAADFNKDGTVDVAVAVHNKIAILLGKGDGSFRQGMEIPEYADPMAISAGDLNGDGTLDLVVGNYYDGVIDVLLGYGNGSFRLSTRVFALAEVPAIVLSDLNGDSKLDIVGASPSSGTAMLVLGTGDGRFLWPSYFGVAAYAFFRTADANADGKADLLAAVPLRKSVFLLERGSALLSFPGVNEYPFDAHFGDFNGDKITDLIVGTLHVLTGYPGEDFGAQILFFPGLPGGGFGPAMATPIRPCPIAAVEAVPIVLATGDFTGDGTFDVAVANNALGAVQVYRGRADGTFELESEFAGSSISSLAHADFDGDGIQDLAATMAESDSIAIYLGSSAGALKAGPTLTGCATPGSLVTADFDGDSRPDLAAACTGSGNSPKVGIYLNSGSGSFRPRSLTFPQLTSGPLLAVADFDGDGKQDLAALEGSHPYPYLDANVGLLLLSNGDGTFRHSGVLGGLPGPVAVAADSWDDDGRPDLAVLGAANATVTLMLNALAEGVPGQLNLASAASLLLGPIAPDLIVAASGEALSAVTEPGSTQSPPTELAGVTVTVTDSSGQSRPAPLLLVSPAQVKFVVPEKTWPGSGMVTLIRDGTAVAQTLTRVGFSVPGIFTANEDGKGVPAAQVSRVKPDGTEFSEPAYRCHNAPGSCVPASIDLGPETEKVSLILLGTGIRHCGYVTAVIGGIDAKVTAVGAQGQLAGVDQVAVLLPRQLAGKGEADLVLNACGTKANPVRINIK